MRKHTVSQKKLFVPRHRSLPPLVMRVNLSHAWSPHDWSDAVDGPAAVAPVSAVLAGPDAASSPRPSDWMFVQYADDLHDPWVTLVLRPGAAAPA